MKSEFKATLISCFTGGSCAVSPKKIIFELFLKSTYLKISDNNDFLLNKSDEFVESEIIEASSTINNEFFILLVFNLV